MEGVSAIESGIMSTSAYTQQLERINQILQEEISLLKTLPEDEAKVLARKNLSELGLVGAKSVRDAVVNGEELVKSINSYDWLGNGYYFWEPNMD